MSPEGFSLICMNTSTAPIMVPESSRIWVQRVGWNAGCDWMTEIPQLPLDRPVFYKISESLKADSSNMVLAKSIHIASVVTLCNSPNKIPIKMHVTMNIPICTSQMKVENKLARTSLITKDKTINEQLRRGKKRRKKEEERNNDMFSSAYS